jgi:deoxycytidylate deaminase
MCAAKVRSERRRLEGDPGAFIQKTAYLFDQFKRPEEIEVLRQIYGRLFILISVYSDKQRRTEYVEGRIAKDLGQGRPSDVDVRGATLIKRDESEENIPHGQRMRDAFSLADLFIDIDHPEACDFLVKRFLSALFGSNTTSPTRDEYAMYSAKSASLRSTDLSRQVGAAIFSPEGEVVAMGCNEVPKAFGGTYWAGDEPDVRDHKLGHDENDRLKQSLLVDVVQRLRTADLIKDEKKDSELVEFILSETERKGSSLRESKLMDIIEFGRIIHAEMSAICDCARLGKSIKGKSLFCTTFPCHICAKHIVASGISRVVYIEPYPKSYVDLLLRDTIELRTSSPHSVSNKVVFSPFIGISPYRYRELFERGKRKSAAGDLVEWLKTPPQPNLAYTHAFHPRNEAVAIDALGEVTAALIREGKLGMSNPPAPLDCG